MSGLHYCYYHLAFGATTAGVTSKVHTPPSVVEQAHWSVITSLDLEVALPIEGPPEAPLVVWFHFLQAHKLNHPLNSGLTSRRGERRSAAQRRSNIELQWPDVWCCSSLHRHQRTLHCVKSKSDGSSGARSRVSSRRPGPGSPQSTLYAYDDLRLRLLSESTIGVRPPSTFLAPAAQAQFSPLAIAHQKHLPLRYSGLPAHLTLVAISCIHNLPYLRIHLHLNFTTTVNFRNSPSRSLPIRFAIRNSMHFGNQV